MRISINAILILIRNANSVQREGSDRERRVSAGALVEKSDARSNGFLELRLHAKVRGSNAFNADVPEGLQDILIGFGRVCGITHEGGIRLDLRMYKFHRHRERRDMDDTREYGRAIESGWRGASFHPDLMQAIHARADNTAEHTALELFVGGEDEHPLRGEARGVEDRDADVGSEGRHGIRDGG